MAVSYEVHNKFDETSTCALQGRISCGNTKKKQLNNSLC